MDGSSDSTTEIPAMWQGEPVARGPSMVSILSRLHDEANALADEYRAQASTFLTQGERQMAATFLHVTHVLDGFSRQAHDCLAALYLTGSSINRSGELLEELFGEGFVSGHVAELEQDRRSHDA